MKPLLAFFLSLLLLNAVVAQEPTLPKAENLPRPPLKKTGEGLYELGAVRIDNNKKTVTFPAVVNMTEGLIEYLLVGAKGKTHESLLATDVPPHQIHLAMLLLGTRDAGKFPPRKKPGELHGDPVTISIAWENDGKKIRLPAEDWIFNRETKKPMAPGPWVYNGSEVNDGRFIAQIEESIVAVVIDQSALINNARPGFESRNNDDEVLYVYQERVPAAGTPVEVTFTLEKAAEAKP